MKSKKNKVSLPLIISVIMTLIIILGIVFFYPAGKPLVDVKANYARFMEEDGKDYLYFEIANMFPYNAECVAEVTIRDYNFTYFVENYTLGSFDPLENRTFKVEMKELPNGTSFGDVYPFCRYSE